MCVVIRSKMAKVKSSLFAFAALMFLGFFMESSNASFKNCYTECLDECVRSLTDLFPCASFCIPKCTVPSSKSTLDCMRSSCASISSMNDHKADQVEKCIVGCGKNWILSLFQALQIKINWDILCSKLHKLYEYL